MLKNFENYSRLETIPLMLSSVKVEAQLEWVRYKHKFSKEYSTVNKNET
jgi:hypothetical protein